MQLRKAWSNRSFLLRRVSWKHSEIMQIRNHSRSLGAFHLVKISGIFGSAVNGTRFVGSTHWKIPRKSGKSKKVGPFSRLEFPNGMLCSISVSRSLYQFQVHRRAPRRTGVYDQMEQLFTNRKFHFCSHRNFRGFFLNGKRPLSLPVKGSARIFWVNGRALILSQNTHGSVF